MPEGALDAPTTITIAQVEGAPRGAVGPAFDLGPDGLEFRVPATLAIAYGDLDLPPGTDPHGLRLSVADRGRWVRVEGQADDPAERTIRGPLAHFSVYGLVPDPAESSGRGTRWEANGVAVDVSEDMFGRLFVSPTAVSLFVGGEATGPVALTWSGLPTDDDNHLYVDGYDGGVVVRPADGGVATLTVDGRSPHYLWLQPRPGTTLVGGPADECPSVGVRSGTTCTLTGDIAGGVSIEAGGETLDCAGRRIYQPLEDRETGIGVLVGGFGAVGPLDDVTIRNCVVGGPDAGFWEGLAATGTDATRLLDSTFSNNMVGAYFAGATTARVAGNRFEGEGNVGIQMYEGSSDGEIAGNTIALVPGIDPIGMMFKGMEGKVALLPTTRMTVDRNTIAGGSVGIGFIVAQANDISDNDIDGPDRGLWIGTDGWPNRFWWNNVTATTWGVYADAGPAEVSDGVRYGNWWSHSCPGPIYAPGADSNRLDVMDSFAYGARDAWLTGGVPGCAGDADGDTVPDGADNCPGVPNPGQENEDGVGEGDACDVTPPPAPMIASPTPWSVLPDGVLRIEGVAERRSTVTVYDLGDVLGRVRANDVGTFAFTPAVPRPDGPGSLTATATDAAGNVSEASDAVPVLVDTVPPAPPVIVSPRSGEILGTGMVPVAGQAEAASEVTVYDDTVRLGSATASSDGEFTFAPAAPLPDGAHSFTATATDAAGRVSAASGAVTVRVLTASPAAPIASSRGKIRVTALGDSPDPLDPVLRQTSTLDAAMTVRGVSGIGGSSPNHSFEVRLAWTIKDARTTTTVRLLAASAAVPTGATEVDVGIRASWDGDDASGRPVPLNELYAYDILLELVRNWTGPGVGPPCARDERSVTTGAGARACLIDELTLNDAGTIHVRHEVFGSGSRQFGRTMEQLEAEHEDAARRMLDRLTPEEQRELGRAMREVRDTFMQVGLRMSRDGTVRNTYGPFMAIPLGLPPGASPEALARAALVRYRYLFGIDDVFGDLAVRDVREDATGRRHVHFEQVLGGLPVFGSHLVVHLTAAGELAGFSGLAIPRDRVDAFVPVVAQADAVATARGLVRPGVVVRGTDATLGVLANESTGSGSGGSLAWRIHLYTDHPAGNLEAFVSAVSGRVRASGNFGVSLAENRNVTYCGDDVRYPCNTAGVLPGLEDIVGGREVVRNSDPVHSPPVWWGDSLHADVAAAATYYLYAEILGEDHWTAPGTGLWVYTDVPEWFFPGFEPNGTWISDDVTRPHVRVHADFGCPEVVAHELTHGAEELLGIASADAVEYVDAGELNEAVSDVLGELAVGLAEPTYHPVPRPLSDAFDWVMGGDPGGVPEWGCPRAFRDLRDAPTERLCALAGAGRFPDTWSEYVYEWNLGGLRPHHNSTIVSTLGCLLGWPTESEGSAPCLGTRHQIETRPVGAEALARVWYGALDDLPGLVSTFHIFRDKLVESALAYFLYVLDRPWMDGYARVFRAVDAVGLFRPEMDHGFFAASGIALASFDYAGLTRTLAFYTGPSGSFPSALQMRSRMVVDAPPHEIWTWSDATPLDYGVGTPAATWFDGRFWVFYAVGRETCCKLRYRTSPDGVVWSRPRSFGGSVDCSAVAVTPYRDAVQVFYKECGDGARAIAQFACTAPGSCRGPRRVVPTMGPPDEPLTSAFGPGAAVLGDRLWLVFGDGEHADTLSAASYSTSPGVPLDGPWSLPGVVGPEPSAAEPTTIPDAEPCTRRTIIEGIQVLSSPSTVSYRGRLHVAVEATDAPPGTDTPPEGLIYASAAVPYDRRAWSQVVFQDHWDAVRRTPVRLFAREPSDDNPAFGYLQAWYVSDAARHAASVEKRSE